MATNQPPSQRPAAGRRRIFLLIAAVASAVLIAGGLAAAGIALATQQHAPQPTARNAGSAGHNPSPARPASASGQQRILTSGPSLPRSVPVTIGIPAIGVHSTLQQVGLASDGSIQVPPPGPRYNQAAWFDGSVTPGQIGASVIEGHIDSAAEGPSVFFRLGALRPGNRVDVQLADHLTATFTVTGVQEYPKAQFPSALIYGNSGYAALRLITCGGSFDNATGHYLSNIVVFATLDGPRSRT